MVIPLLRGPGLNPFNLHLPPRNDNAVLGPVMLAVHPAVIVLVLKILRIVLRDAEHYQEYDTEHEEIRPT